MKRNFSCLLIAFTFPVLSWAQHTILGSVKTPAGEPVPFATVRIPRTQLGAITSETGGFTITNVPVGLQVLNARCVGYAETNDTIMVDGSYPDVNDKRLGNGEIVVNLVMREGGGSLDEVVVNATRVGKESGIAYNNVDAETLKKQNLGQDAPYMLNMLPSVVVNSDAGNAVGYTGLRIRGSDATRVNVTINGVPVNDAESQGTFFVDMPDLVTSVNSIQVQRGVGTSANGPGAFGASINFQTNTLNEKPYGNVISTAGSYNTFRNTLAAGTGLLGGKFTVDARASSVTSDGYRDRASSRLRSYYAAAGYYGKKSVVKLINFRGWERTYQAWNLVPQDSLDRGNRTYNENGLYYDSTGAIKYYPNEVDNYDQNNFQLHFIHRVNTRVHFNLTGFYTKGKGYYEEYRNQDPYSDYGIPPASPDMLYTDLVRRQWLDNDFAGGVGNINYTHSERLQFTLGGGYNTYFGKHFGNVIQLMDGRDPQNHRYYMNTANKNGGNVYFKVNYKPVARMNIFVDLQGRNVVYSYMGPIDSTLAERMQTARYVFFNPKAGASYDLSSHVNVYASVSRGSREPNRDDFVQSSPASRPRPEYLTDAEAGVRYAGRIISGACNFFNMDYTDQLVLNGEVNDVGAYNRVNVAKSYRRGVELELAAVATRYFRIAGNVTFSENKINTYTEFGETAVTYHNTDISFSPRTVAGVQLTVIPVRRLEITFQGKHVDRQYLDNTQTRSRSIDPYQVLDVRINYTVKTKMIPEIGIFGSVYNVLNAKYETNGYTYGYSDGSQYLRFVYKAPAAPTNFLAGLNIRF